MEEKKSIFYRAPLLVTVLLTAAGAAVLTLLTPLLADLPHLLGGRAIRPEWQFTLRLALALILLVTFLIVAGKRFAGPFARGEKRMSGLLLLPVILVILQLIVSAIYGHLGTPRYRTVYGAMGDCLTEEIIFRILPLSFALRYRESESFPPAALVVTALLLGLYRLVGPATMPANLRAVSVLRAVSTGLLLGGIYLRSGNCLYSLVSGLLIAVVRSFDVSLSGVPYLAECALALLQVVMGMFLVRKEIRGKIIALWARKWEAENRE